MSVRLSLTINGKAVSADIDPRTLLVQFIREQQQLTGTHVGCDTAQCGACTVHLNGRAVKSLHDAGRAGAGRRGHDHRGPGRPTATLHPMQAAFRECHGLQCGFCTPGMVMSAVKLLEDKPKATEQRDPRGAGGQHLPLHRLSQHRQVDPALPERQGRFHRRQRLKSRSQP